MGLRAWGLGCLASGIKSTVQMEKPMITESTVPSQGMSGYMCVGLRIEA